MTADRLLADLRARGVALEARGDRLRYRPPDRVTGADLAAMQRLKPELLRLLTNSHVAPLTSVPAVGGRCRTYLDDAKRNLPFAEASAGDALARMALRAVTCRDDEPVAWRLYSRRLDRELWLVRDAAALAALLADGAMADLPVVLADELPGLRGRDDEHLRRLLDAKGIFGPTTRLADLTDEEDRT